MNPRQRRGFLLLLVSLLGALGVFVGLARYTSSVAAQVGGKIAVLKLTADVPAFGRVASSAVETVQVPRSYVTDAMVTRVSDLDGLVAATGLAAGSYLDRSMLRTPPTLDRGQRELAILIDAETGVGGKIRRGDYVDIYATFSGDSARGALNQARIIVHRAQVIEIGDLTSETKGNGKGSFSTQKVVPVTFALSVRDSLVLAYAESFAETVRLALTSPADRAGLLPQERILQGLEIAAPGGGP
jgi:pilus assembly protein CpaB